METLFANQFIKIFKKPIKESLDEYSDWLYDKLKDCFKKKDEEYYNHKLDDVFYRFKITREDINILDTIHNKILTPFIILPDGIALQSLVDNNQLFFKHLDYTTTLNIGETVIFPYSEIYNIKEPSNYYAVSFSQK